jgi:phasin family protein
MKIRSDKVHTARQYQSLVFERRTKAYNEVMPNEWDQHIISRRSKVAKDDTSKEDGKVGKGDSFVFDFAKLLGPYSLAGVDYSKLLERERKNISALTEANKIVFEGWQTLVRRQSEIFQETMAQTVATARKQDGAKSRTDLAKQGFETALANMREISELATQCQHEAFGIVHKRIGEHMDELQASRKAK